ncbi:MAG TPA: IS66 family insertion sequence element accessory protein TnpB [Bryobacteraceae bacterium]|jgi:hypothetical protein|nr:IS66 family insertion sequence element accessory protein TnpB [Bryobacteraceae bacterium]
MNTGRRKVFASLSGFLEQFALCSKRLEQGTYAMPAGEAAEHRREITTQELAALLSGIDLQKAVRRKRYQL